MTFNEISVQMLRSNYKRYLLYFYCNVFTIALFYAFAAIYTNADFMNPSVVDSSISSNIIAPSMLTVLFMLLFIPYSYRTFFKNRKNEYGILMTLGMSEKEVLTNMMIENITVSMISLIGGLTGGTFLSVLFFQITQKWIGVHSIAWKFNLRSYGITAAVYLAVVFVTLVLHMIGFIKAQIAELLKARFRKERGSKNSAFFLIAGCLISILSVVVMIAGYGYGTTYVWFISLACLSIGSWMILSNINGLIEQKKRQKINIGMSFILQQFKSYKIVTFMVVWLFGMIVFFAGYSAVTYPNFLNNAISYSPYDLLYIQVDQKNDLSVAGAKELLSKYNVNVTEAHEISYLRDGSVNLLPISEVNQLSGSSYTVDPGEYFVIYQFDPMDGYEHMMNASGTRKFGVGAEGLELNYAGQDVRILFNHNHGFADVTLALNERDYKALEERGEGFYSGLIKCFLLDDWKDSGRGLDALQQRLAEKNHLDASEQSYFKISTKLDTYSTAKQSAQFLLFVMFFVMILFYLSANVILFFKIQGEMEAEKRMIQGLFRIGISENEMQSIINYKNFYYSSVPLFAGCAIGVFYNYTVNAIYGYGFAGIGYGLLISAFLIVTQSIICKRFSRYEKKSLRVGGSQ